MKAWNKFFFEPQSTIPLAVFRIVYGVLVMVTLLFLQPDWFHWYGAHPWISLPTMLQIQPGSRLDVFTLIPQTDNWIGAVFWIFLASAFLLTIGFFTRVNTVIVFLCFASVQQRNLYITHGGDVFLRVAGFFLMFAPAGAALSVDAFLHLRSGKKVEIMRSPWAQRMIQFELALLYFSAFCWKVQGESWLHGTALAYVYQLNELRRFPLPSWFLLPIVLKLGNWGALVVEFSMGTLIWIRKLRYYVMALGVAFHLVVEYSLNIPLFEWDVLAGYLLFIDASDYQRLWKFVRRTPAAS